MNSKIYLPSKFYAVSITIFCMLSHVSLDLSPLTKILFCRILTIVALFRFQCDYQIPLLPYREKNIMINILGGK